MDSLVTTLEIEKARTMALEAGVDPDLIKGEPEVALWSDETNVMWGEVPCKDDDREVEVTKDIFMWRGHDAVSVWVPYKE